ncbi:MAG: prepilin-type N-terminal cleavage/methylation domain-containing protein [Kiritimatiellae bacterium]|nr:prepilin-type N-terminal cleavage/methylation domain-containing protein [Kiritimatiellia bacterium]
MKTKGFTLVEIMIVVAIFETTATIETPQVSSEKHPTVATPTS